MEIFIKICIFFGFCFIIVVGIALLEGYLKHKEKEISDKEIQEANKDLKIERLK